MPHGQPGGLGRHNFFYKEVQPRAESKPGCMEDLQSKMMSPQTQHLLDDDFATRFRPVNAGSTTMDNATRQKHNVVFERWPEAGPQSRHGPLFSEHPPRHIRNQPTREQAAQGTELLLSCTYYPCRGDGVNGCGVPVSTPGSAGAGPGAMPEQRFICGGDAGIVVHVRSYAVAVASTQSRSRHWRYELMAVLRSRYPDGMHVDVLKSSGVNWRPMPGPGVILDDDIRTAATSYALQGGKSRVPSMLLGHLYRNQEQKQLRQDLDGLEIEVRQLGLVPVGVDLQAAPNLSRLQSFYKNTRKRTKLESTSWSRLVHFLTRKLTDTSPSASSDQPGTRNLVFDEDAPGSLPGRIERSFGEFITSAVGVRTNTGVAVVGTCDKGFVDKTDPSDPWGLALARPSGVARLINDGQVIIGADACWKVCQNEVAMTVITTERKPIFKRWSRQGSKRWGGGMGPRQQPGEAFFMLHVV
jgi:hypothetical protein